MCHAVERKTAKWGRAPIEEEDGGPFKDTGCTAPELWVCRPDRRWQRSCHNVDGFQRRQGTEEVWNQGQEPKAIVNFACMKQEQHAGSSYNYWLPVWVIFWYTGLFHFHVSAPSDVQPRKQWIQLHPACPSEHVSRMLTKYAAHIGLSIVIPSGELHFWAMTVSNTFCLSGWSSTHISSFSCWLEVCSTL